MKTRTHFEEPRLAPIQSQVSFGPDHHRGALWHDDVGTVVVVDVDELLADGIHPHPLAGVTAIVRLGVDPAADDVLLALDYEEELRRVRITERVEQGRFGFLDDIGCCRPDLHGSDQSDEYEFDTGADRPQHDGEFMAGLLPANHTAPLNSGASVASALRRSQVQILG